MTADYEDDEFELEDFEEDDFEDEVDAVNAELEAFARQSYSRVRDLTGADWEAMGTMVRDRGLTAEEAFEALVEDQHAEDFADLVERVEAGESRTLTPTERHRLAELDARAELTGEDDVDVSSALLDLDSSDGRAQFIAERLQVPQERDEPSANVLDPETGEERPGFNLDDPSERVEVIDRLLEGTDTTTYDNSYEENE